MYQHYIDHTGADPIKLVEDLAKRKRIKTVGVSMGQGQEIIARNYLAAAITDGQWLLLQNTHLGLTYLTEVPFFIANGWHDVQLHESRRGRGRLVSGCLSYEPAHMSWESADQNMNHALLRSQVFYHFMSKHTQGSACRQDLIICMDLSR